MVDESDRVSLPKPLVYALIIAIFAELIVIGGYMVQWNIDYQISRATTDGRLDRLERKILNSHAERR